MKYLVLLLLAACDAQLQVKGDLGDWVPYEVFNYMNMEQCLLRQRQVVVHYPQYSFRCVVTK